MFEALAGVLFITVAVAGVVAIVAKVVWGDR